jgi:hypothetical protein
MKRRRDPQGVPRARGDAQSFSSGFPRLVANLGGQGSPLRFLAAGEAQDEVHAVDSFRGEGEAERSGLAQLERPGAFVPRELQRGAQQQGFDGRASRQNPGRIEKQKRDELAVRAQGAEAHQRKEADKAPVGVAGRQVPRSQTVGFAEDPGPGRGMPEGCLGARVGELRIPRLA